MSSEESGHVYRLHSTLELPLEDLHDHLDEATYPDGIADVELTRRNNTLILKADAEDDSVSKYTPSAQLKASVTENRVYEEDPDERRNAFRWEDEEEEEIESELVEYAAFKGDRETVLQNSLLQYEMFLVLCDIAEQSEKGTLTAISDHDGDLEATRIVDGEVRPADVEVVEGPRDTSNSSGGVNWRDNKFISD
ncbi:DUF7110 family protein [Halovivax cerinus]|uniref:Uncharacterized protein n=1 Tax=Halovivax cerinus TaxID=1487865 RepID=A0ABD5NNA7_9EURY|nr:hypothetical protein [Halovivax cerinus]